MNIANEVVAIRRWVSKTSEVNGGWVQNKRGEGVNLRTYKKLRIEMFVHTKW